MKSVCINFRNGWKDALDGIRIPSFLVLQKFSNQPYLCYVFRGSISGDNKFILSQMKKTLFANITNSMNRQFTSRDFGQKVRMSIRDKRVTCRLKFSRDEPYYSSPRLVWVKRE